MRLITRTSVTALSSALLLLTACSGAPDQPSSVPEAVLVDNGDNDANWAGYGRTYGEQHFSPLDQVNAQNVSELKLAWAYDLPAAPSATQPIAVDGVIYLSSGLSVVRAVDARSGKLLWEYDPQAGEVAGEKMRQGWGNRGIAYSDGRVYTGTIDGRLIAIDAKLGKLVWSVQTTEPNDDRYITGAPRVMGGRILIGHGGADSAAIRGYVTAYDARDGKEIWRFYTVPGNPKDGFENAAMEAAAKTWAGSWWLHGGGGNVWNAMSYDPELDMVYIGTGNGAPWNWRVRSEGKGDNLYLASIVALDAKTGDYRWHYQVNPAEMWDYNAAADMHLADIDIDGKPRKVLMQAPKNGFLYLLDRATGKLLAAQKIAKVTWANGIDLKTGRPIENPDARYPDGKDFELWPSMTGAHSAPPSSYDPKTGWMYIPLIEKGAFYNDRGIDPKSWKRTPGNAYDFATNFSLTEQPKDPLQSTGWLLAVDPVTGRQAWRVRLSEMFNGGVMSTGGGLVFQGEITGRFNAFSAADGKRLWTFDAGAPVIGAPISFSVDGKQYVSVVTGMGSSAGPVSVIASDRALSDYRAQPRRLLTFMIGGSAKLAPTERYRPKAALDPAYKPDAKLAEQGAAVYGVRCFVCHGPNAVSGGNAPDLRVSNVPVSEDAFRTIVRDGGIAANGMPGFPELSDKDLAALRQYLREQTAALRAK